MNLELNAALVCLDVESTGDIPTIDRVCSIAIMKFHPDGRQTEFSTLINPTIHIPEFVSKIHNIYDEDVAHAPTFEDIAPRLAAGLQKCDFAGYNLRKFDLPMLAEEFRRVRARPEQILGGRVVDIFRLYQKYEPRTLSDAVRKYLKREHTGAHDAMEDVRATMQVFEAMLEAHDDLPRTVEDIHRLLFETPREGHVDPDGKLVRRGNEVYLTFGAKTSGKRLADVDDGFLKWILRGDFTPSVKTAVEDELERRRQSAY